MSRLDEAVRVSTVQHTGEGQGATAHGRARRARQPIRLIGGAILALTLAIPRPAYALFGEEDWLSGQNQTLMALLWEELEHTTQLSTLIANAKFMVGSVNELLALARTARRVFEAIKNYDLEALERDVLQSLYRAIPESQGLAQEIDTLYRDGRAIHEGKFWTRIGAKDAKVSYQARKLWEHGYKATLWPLVLPGEGHLRRGPSIVEAKVATRYQVSGDEARRAFEQSAIAILAGKVKAFAADAELKDRVDLKREATRAQLELQRTADAAELRRLREQAVAEDQNEREALESFQRQMSGGLRAGAEDLVGPPRWADRKPTRRSAWIW
ncbi:MAG: hypothetical protein RIT81_14915 [Deltaproteobacteria bacterium]